VSIAGVTGTKSANIDEVGNHVKDIKKKTDLPVVVGFGIKTPDDAANMSKIADGVVVGSAIVENMFKNQADGNLTGIISEQVEALKKAV
jgi:tryptophan synthase alpha chain